MQTLPALEGDIDKAHDLRQAFAVFNQVSAELTLAYEQLQGKVSSLTAELAVANGELRRQYEEKQTLSDRLGLLLNALPAGVVALNEQGWVEDLNPAAMLMLGSTMLGCLWQDAVGPRLQKTDTLDEWVLLPEQGQGGQRRLTIAEQWLPSGGGRILLLHDVTSAHEMKTSLARNQRLAAMGEMAASLAHQLRTPLSAALLYSANLGTPGLAEGARARFAEKATEQLRRLERLIHDVLLFARGEEIGRERISLNAFIAEAVQEVEPVFREKKVVLRTILSQTDYIVVGGRKPLGSALVSLLENALQASETGAEVSVQASFSGRMAKIAVRDAGGGIPSDILARVFEPFFTTRAQGTGLGLAIALGVLRAHAGGIDVQSSLGKGTEFTLVLPAEAVTV